MDVRRPRADGGICPCKNHTPTPGARERTILPLMDIEPKLTKLVRNREFRQGEIIYKWIDVLAWANFNDKWIGVLATLSDKTPTLG